MNGYLRQSTNAQSRIIGPFLDDADGKTPETALAIAHTDVKLIVNGGAAVDKNSGGGTHRANGEYSITLNAADTATVGELLITVAKAGALPVRARFMVLEEVVYDAFFAAGATAQVDLIDAPNATAAAALATAHLDLADGVESEWTVRQLLRIALGIFAGNSTGGGANFTNPAGTKTRIASTLDANGNRTVTSKDVS